MSMGKGTYGSKKGRPPKKSKMMNKKKKKKWLVMFIIYHLAYPYKEEM